MTLFNIDAQGQNPICFGQVMNYSQKLFFCVANGSAASFAYERLHLHLRAASIQMSRIQQVQSSIQASKPDVDTDAQSIHDHIADCKQRMQLLLSEVHFYFVSWTGCRNMLQVLVTQTEFLEAKKVFDKYRKIFDHYVAGRHSFEHFHDRLPGGKDARRVNEVREIPDCGGRRIFQGIRRGKYVHSKDEWDISPENLEMLDTLIREILTIIHAKIDEECEQKQIHF
jgi:hypothetical protein